MKVDIKKQKTPNGSTIAFEFTLDSQDKKRSTSTNAGNSEIFLESNKANFYFTEDFELPHPDLCALAALKIISPYIGEKLDLSLPVSKEMAAQILKTYPNIKVVSIDANLVPRSVRHENPAIAFSGGADSVAAAALLKRDTPLILSSRTWHPEIGKYEPWYSTKANIETLNRMPSRFKKVLVESDFEFLSTNGKYCIYPDAYAFTIPALLLADHLDLSHIITGDIWVAFNANETVFNKNLYSKHNDIFKIVSLPLEPVINGIGELGSAIIAENSNLLDIATTCQYGEFQKPCMKCIKCFRKSIHSWGLFNSKIKKSDIEKLNNSPGVRNFAANQGRAGLYFAPSFKEAFQKIEYDFDGAIKEIRDKMINLPYKTDFTQKIFGAIYQSNRPLFTESAFFKMQNSMPLMSSEDENDFASINYKDFIKN